MSILPFGNAETNQNRVVTPASESARNREIRVAPETIDRTGKALFVLWLKIGATLVAAKLVIVLWPVFSLVLLSLLLVAAFNPVVRRLQNRLSRGKAITVVVGGAVTLITGLLALMIPPLLGEGRRLLTELPRHLGQLKALAREQGISVRFGDLNLPATTQGPSIGPESVQALTPIFSAAAAVLTVAVLTAYLLIDGPRVATGLLSLLPRHHRLPVRQMFGEIGGQVGNYMRGQLITSGLAGGFTLAVLLLCGVPQPFALAFLMAVADAIPLVGPIIGTVPAVLMALTQGTTTALIVLVSLVVYQGIEGYILVPRIYGTTMRLTSTAIVLATLIGATLFGMLGVVLALPVAAAVPVALRYLREMREREEAA